MQLCIQTDESAELRREPTDRSDEFAMLHPGSLVGEIGERAIEVGA